ncbi:LANO_0F13344g1_1 [Lachancea nothofagi CBS 11611]|uniref:LANO_0F13344g1_1 n=1 Tax=Lachancea nothofagi CBS 11611 TaxID=1266666 RepID=A0A1G4KBS5_9SACH|nr:LANO_0F13344g1_1 [Lachancea nothofagi CBS 11611]
MSNNAHRIASPSEYLEYEIMDIEPEKSHLQRLSHEYLKPNIGLVYLLTANLFNSAMVVSTKLLETDPTLEAPITPLQILVVRMFITYVGTLIYMYWNRAKIDHVPWGPPEMRKWLILRGFTGFFGVFGMYYSLMYLSVPDATVITFLGPSLTGILAWIILHERYSKVEALGGVISLFGVVLIVRPTFLLGGSGTGQTNDAVESSDPKDRLFATLVALVGVLGSCNVYIIIRYIGNRVHAIMTVSYFALIVCVVSFVGICTIPSIGFQMPQTGRQWFLFSLIGFSGFFMQLLLTLGIQKERAGRGAFMAYSQVIYALLWDMIIWHHLPGLWSWCGMIVIVGCGIWVIRFKPKPEITVLTGQDSIQMENFEIEEESQQNKT